MNIEQRIWTKDRGWQQISPIPLKSSARFQLVLAFGSRSIFKEKNLLEEIRAIYPGAHIFGCSTAGEICGAQVLDDSLVITAVYFEYTKINGTQLHTGDVKNSYEAGTRLAQSLNKKGLVHVIVLSDGLNVNGSELVRGLREHLPEQVIITGGLAADGERFQETAAFWDEMVGEKTIAAMGLYGNRLKVGYGSMGGWDPFGPERLITRSEGNILYEFDGRSALQLYKDYLGDYAAGLPATGLLFPLSIRTIDGGKGLVRTILSVDEKNQSMTFAGDVPEGMYARLMKANFDRLIDGAIGAAKTSYEATGSASPDLALLISCVGRKLVLKQRTEEEVEGVREIFRNHATMTGFYSYGEISPFAPNAKCELHNQTMTITTLSER